MSEKVNLKPVKPQTLFFPSVDEFIEFLGISVSARSKLAFFEAELGRLPISKRSRDNLGKDGISHRLARRTAWPIMRFLYKNGGFSRLLRFPRWIRKNDVIHFWIAAVDGLAVSCEDLDFRPLFAFFKYRNERYQPVKSFLDSSPRLNEQNQFELLLNFYSIALPQTLLTTEQQNTILDIIRHFDREMSFDEYQTECLLNWYFDFHLSLFAAIDVTLSVNVQTSKDYENGIFTHIFQQRGATYFSKLLTHLKTRLSVSDYKLAQHIPIERDESKPLSTSLQEAQKKTLQEWRNGSTKPKTRTLVKFYESFGDDFDYFPVLMFSIFCLALDRRIADQRMRPFENAFQAVFSAENYSKYFLYYKEKLPLLAASD